MMGVSESAKVLKAYLDESAGSVPPKVYGAISTAVVLMDAFGKALDAAADAVVRANAPAITGALVHVEERDGR